MNGKPASRCRHQPSRQKLRTHNDGSEGIVIIQVYWDMDTHNTLHRHALLRVAVCAVCLAKDGIFPGAQDMDSAERGPIFSNSYTEVKMWVFRDVFTRIFARLILQTTQNRQARGTKWLKIAIRDFLMEAAHDGLHHQSRAVTQS